MTAAQRYWLMKSEPDVYSIDDLAREGKTPWDGVRNYQARNFMREMQVGDLVLFYHSNTTSPGVAGIARICREAYPDYTARNPQSDYFDPKSTPDNPIWMMVDVEFVEKFPHFVPLEELRSVKDLEGMLVLRRGMRLSIQPVEPTHFTLIRKMGQG
jgi:predicted RNA-binding protein with PUA-like domain